MFSSKDVIELLEIITNQNWFNAASKYWIMLLFIERCMSKMYFRNFC